MNIEVSEEELNDDLPIPTLLENLIASGQWRHPGGNILRKIIPFIEEIDFLCDIERIRKESAFLRNERMGALPSADPRSTDLPYLDSDRALLIATNREHGDDVAIALDYRTSMTDPRIVASSMESGRRWIWREVSPSFSQLVNLINAAAAKEEAGGDMANAAPPRGPLTFWPSMLLIFIGVGFYLADCQFSYEKHPDLPWILSGMYSGFGIVYEIAAVCVGIYCLANPPE